MNNNRMRVLLALTVSALVSGSASAAPLIQGSIAFSGSIDTLPSSGDLSTATELTFPSTAVTPGNQFGDYSPVPDFHPVTFNNVVFSPPTVGATLWSFSHGGIDYSFTIDTMIVDHEPNSLELKGLGTASITGLDDTQGTWIITANQSGQSLSFSASTAVPDGGTTVGLLGLTLLGLGMGRRYLKS